VKIVSRIKKLRPRTWAIAGAVAVVVVGGGTTWAVLASNAGAASASAQAVTTQSVAASLQTMQKTIDTSGTLAPTVQEDVDFAVAGTVTAVAVQAGSTVTAGDVLATVDTLTVQSEALAAQAALAKAQATLASAEADDDGTDTSATQIAADEASVAVAQAAADKAVAAVADATLVAPVSGLVTAVNLEVGDTTSGSGSSSSSGTSGSGTSGTGSGSTGTGSSSSSTSSSAFTIVSTDSWQVSLSVGETDVANVTVGDQVELSTDDGTAFFGTVSTVGMLPSTTSGAATYPVTVAVTGSPEGLYDGISITASIVYERRTDVLTVPSAAVTTASDGTTSVSAVDADGNETTTTVTVGETVGTLTEITAGLAEGDLVAVTTFTPGAGNSGTGGMGGTGTQQGTGTFPGGGTMPQGFDPSQMSGGGQMPGGTTSGN